MRNIVVVANGTPNGTVPPRKVTLDLILASTSLSRLRAETNESFLERITHLHLQNKHIRHINKLEKCINLKVLYLYDNWIEVIENLDFATKLQYLHLENNAIKSIPTLRLDSLVKLYLDENEIAMVKGLEACVRLEELHIAKQRLPPRTSLEFDKSSLVAISHTLEVLEISGNGLFSLADFAPLVNLKKLVCRDNAINEVSTIGVVLAMPVLADLDCTGNPCCSLRRYRDYVIGVAPMSLEVLDELPIPKHQQRAIKGLQVHREKIGANMSMSYSLPQASPIGSASEEESSPTMDNRSGGEAKEDLSAPGSPLGRAGSGLLTPGEQTDASSWDGDEEDAETSNDDD